MRHRACQAVLSSSLRRVPISRASTRSLVPVLHNARRYATQSTLNNTARPSRRQITVANDDGRVRWTDLSPAEKVARSTQQTFNFGIVLLGVFMTGGVFLLLFTDVFAFNSKTRHFDRAVEILKDDVRVTDLLGPRDKLYARGTAVGNGWTRNHELVSRTYTDAAGVEHLEMNFLIDGPLKKGLVDLHLVKKPGQDEYEYKRFVLNLKDHPPLYLVNTDPLKGDGKKQGLRLFGVQWR